MLSVIKKIMIFGFIVVLNQISLMAVGAAESKWKEVKDDTGTVSKVTVTIINKMDDKVLLTTDVIGIPRGLAGLKDYAFRDTDTGTSWVDKGTTSLSNDKYAPDGNAAIHFERESGYKDPSSIFYEIKLDGKDHTYGFTGFSIDVKAKPVLVFYPRIPYFSSPEGPWTYPFYDYEITISPKK